jgi:5-hydroxyisourate hydrolase-like protein (transthyretin family)
MRQVVQYMEHQATVLAQHSFEQEIVLRLRISIALAAQHIPVAACR